ncbi:MAG: DUF4418 family protein [Finegoldia magna]|uniref:DUF4418 family protein n=1 Tax=Finegoldia magna TaxID=1260 RepID=A0A943L7H2_FINMA|nr:DUF4418 family protein [Finegoldia magna]MBS5965207.1 DUF4418 family protein [Finegoldia magna]MDU1399908.1 DUF4418 family protein [Finegoldia magna]MDU5369691.1 DUF4418 family protein [Finegoldia magna]MDU5444649.1 DUF4418 family protein [Finegoldia magna]MDU7384669.1 DUF4418 family protein [Finegoldia magna]
MKKILKILQLVVAIILALIPKVNAKPCKVMPGKMPMKCFHMSNAEILIISAITLLVSVVIALIEQIFNVTKISKDELALTLRGN